MTRTSYRDADRLWAELVGVNDEHQWTALRVYDEPEVQEFMGTLTRDMKRTLKRTASRVGRSKFVRSVGNGLDGAGKVVKTISNVVPVAAVVKLANQVPLGMFARMTYGALTATLRGRSFLSGVLDGLGGSALGGGLLNIGGAVLRGDNLIAASKNAIRAGIADAREALRFAAMVAPFVPGVGTGVVAALGAASALASGQPITAAVVAGVRAAIPGGALAQTAFDTGTQLASGKSIDESLLGAARNQLPAGPARAAFDTGLALARGRKIQEAALVGAGGLLPPSPYSADALSFARRALAGENLGQAALSSAGSAVLRRAQQQGARMIGTAQRPHVAAVRPSQRLRATSVKSSLAAAQRRERGSLEYEFAVAERAQRRSEDLFLRDLMRRA